VGGMIGHCVSPQPWREIEAHGYVSNNNTVNKSLDRSNPMKSINQDFPYSCFKINNKQKIIYKLVYLIKRKEK